MQDNIHAARAIAEARTADYSARLWAAVAVVEGADGPHVTFSGIVGAALLGREAALSPARHDLVRFPRPEFDPFAIAVLAAWFLDFNYFRFSLEPMPVALLFGSDPVPVNTETGTKLAIAAAQFLSGYQEEDADKRAAAVPFVALSIKEAMWGSALPEEWL